MKTVFAVLVAVLWVFNSYAVDEYNTAEEVPVSVCEVAGKSGVKINVAGKFQDSYVYWYYNGAVYQMGTHKEDGIFRIGCIKYSE